MQEVERRIGDRAAAARVDAERPELLVHPADPDAEDQPPAGQLLDRRDPLGGQQRRPVGHDQHADAEADPLGDPGEEGERRERLEVAPVRALRVLGRERQVIGDPEIVDPGRLGGARAAASSARVDCGPMLRRYRPSFISFSADRGPPVIVVVDDHVDQGIADRKAHGVTSAGAAAWSQIVAGCGTPADPGLNP